MIRKRFLRANHGTEVPSNLLFFDTESNEPLLSKRSRTSVLSLRLWKAVSVRFNGKACDREIVGEGFDSASFWEFLYSRCQGKKPLYAFAHNLNFDFTLLHGWERIESGELRNFVAPKDGTPHGEHRKKPFRGRLCVESSPMFMYLMAPNGPVRFVDTANYWPKKLSSIGERLGVPKTTMPNWDADVKDWLEYCENDCRVIQAAICDLLKRWKQEDCGVFRPTAPGLAMQNFRHTCPVKTPDGSALNIVMDQSHEAVPYERQAYFGGRIEPFYLGVQEGTIYHLDVNSLYPYVMKENLFPRKRFKVLREPSIAELCRYINAYGIIAEVTIESDHETFPYRVRGVQLHCKGRFRTTLASPELRRAIKTGSVHKVHWACLYGVANIFEHWVKVWYDRKLTAQVSGPSHAGELELCKLILNSLSGKWAQRGEFWKTIDKRPLRPDWGQWMEIDADKNTQRLMRNVAGICQEYVRGEEPEHSFPAISAFITSHAREYMRELFSVCPPQSIYYTATDSIICNEEGYEALLASHRVHDTALGLLKMQGIHKRLETFGPNHYHLDDTVVRSGSWAKMKPDPRGGWYFESWQQANGTVATKPNGTISITEIVLKHSTPTPKGVKLDSGWVDPFTITLDHTKLDGIPKRPTVG